KLVVLELGGVQSCCSTTCCSYCSWHCPPRLHHNMLPVLCRDPLRGRQALRDDPREERVQGEAVLRTQHMFYVRLTCFVDRIRN
uniref:Uncharacterized protein n=1 Tax=Aegilops tauschii subsp. strangulata TaxID=200361 RepID=A0A452ZD91_AEGTS